MPRKKQQIAIANEPPTCGSCRFWAHDPQNDEAGCGHCKFNPPVPMFDPEESVVFTAFPMVEATEGACGKFVGRH
jgi:hypothetical protein